MRLPACARRSPPTSSPRPRSPGWARSCASATGVPTVAPHLPPLQDHQGCLHHRAVAGFQTTWSRRAHVHTGARANLGCMCTARSRRMCIGCCWGLEEECQEKTLLGAAVLLGLGGGGGVRSKRLHIRAEASVARADTLCDVQLSATLTRAGSRCSSRTYGSCQPSTRWKTSPPSSTGTGRRS